MSYRADIHDSDGRKVTSRHLNVAASGDQLRDIDAAGSAARQLLRPGQYADLYEHNGGGRAIYVDTVQAVTR